MGENELDDPEKGVFETVAPMRKPRARPKVTVVVDEDDGSPESGH